MVHQRRYTMVKYYISLVIYVFLVPIAFLWLLLVSGLFFYRKKQKIIFGSTPILNNKYWSEALKSYGYDATTLMRTFYSNINKKDDFELYFDDLIPNFMRTQYLREVAYLFCIWYYIIHFGKMIVMPFEGFVYKKFFWRLEWVLCRINRINVIVLPYGSDAYMYSRIYDSSLQNALLMSYPLSAIHEDTISKKVFFWSKYANCIITGFMGCDGMPRWDIPLFQWIHINSDKWGVKQYYSNNNGINGVVKILHTPNHRGFKGTEYLLNAINHLKQEGLNIELVLLENVTNDNVQKMMLEVDILAEQFIATAYALSGIEGMASGLPVLANLDNEHYTTLFRRYSFLNECPILSTSPESLKENLRLLVTNPTLRQELGMLGRKYVEKYHSYKTTYYLFSHIFKKLDGENIDLMNLFHPLTSAYVQKDYIQTPLNNNHYIK